VVSTTAYHPGIEKDPDELVNNGPGPFSIEPGKRKAGESLPSTPNSKHSILGLFSKRYLLLTNRNRSEPKQVALSAFSSKDRHRWFLRQDNAGDEKGTR